MGLIVATGLFLGTTLSFLATTIYCCLRARNFKKKLPYQRVRNHSEDSSQNRQPQRSTKRKFIKKTISWPNKLKLKRFRKKKINQDLESTGIALQNLNKNASQPHTKPYKPSKTVEKSLIPNYLLEADTVSIAETNKTDQTCLTAAKSSTFKPLKPRQAPNTEPSYVNPYEVSSHRDYHDPLDIFHQRFFNYKETLEKAFEQHQKEEKEAFQKHQQSEFERMRREAQEALEYSTQLRKTNRQEIAESEKILREEKDKKAEFERELRWRQLRQKEADDLAAQKEQHKRQQAREVHRAQVYHQEQQKQQQKENKSVKSKSFVRPKTRPPDPPSSQVNEDK